MCRNRQHVPGSLRRRRGSARGPGTCVPILALTERGNSVLLCRCSTVRTYHRAAAPKHSYTDILGTSRDHRALAADAEQGAQSSLIRPLISHSPPPNERRGRLDTIGRGGSSSVPGPPVPNPSCATFLRSTPTGGALSDTPEQPPPNVMYLRRV